MNRMPAILVLALLLGMGVTYSQDVPATVSYQGVLRDATGAPREGIHDMVFRFFTAEVGGDEILVDTHDAGGGNAVTVTNGLFGVDLGGGSVTDGSGPGIHDLLSVAFQFNPAIWMSIEVDGELLSPRVHVRSVPFAHKAGSIGTWDANGLLNVGTDPQTKLGGLTILDDLLENKLTLAGGNWNADATDGDFKIGNDTYKFKIGIATDGGGAGSTRLVAQGGANRMQLGTGIADDLTIWNDKVGIGTTSPAATLDVAGNGQFSGLLSANGGMTLGASPFQLSGGAKIHFDDTRLTLQAGDSFDDDIALHAGFSDTSGSILIQGADSLDMTAGNGQFNLINGVTSSVIATFDQWNVDLSGSLHLGGSTTPGVAAILDFDNSGARFASQTGLTTITAGANSTDILQLYAGNSGANGGFTAVGNGVTQIRTGGGTIEFQSLASGSAVVMGRMFAAGDLQIDGGLTIGDDPMLESSIETHSNFGDTEFRRTGPGSWARIFYSQDLVDVEQMRIQGGDEAVTLFDGAVLADGLDYAEAFRISDPTLEPGDLVVLDPDRPGFVARSRGAYAPGLLGALSEAPAFVTGNSFDAETKADPQIAARRAEARAAGDRQLERELTVELIKQKKQRQRPVALAGRIPVKVDGSYGPIHPGDPLTSSPTPGHAMAMDQAGPTIGIALEGFKGEGRGKVLTFVRSGMMPAEGLGASVTRRADTTAGPVAGAPPAEPKIQGVGTANAVLLTESGRGATFSVSRTTDAGKPGEELVRIDGQGNIYTRGSFRPSAMDVAEYFPADGPFEVGDVLSIGPDGTLSRARTEADPAVVGIVSEEPGVLLGSGITRIAEADPDLSFELQRARRIGDAVEEARIWSKLEARFAATHAAIALTGTIPCRVDAGYGEIRPGDLLTASPTPGHAMRAPEDAAPGSVIGKALAPLAAGSGTIRVMVWRR